MGIKLGDIVPKRQINFDNLKNKKIAVDFSNMAYQFLSNVRDREGNLLTDKKGQITSVYVGILSRITNLMSKDIITCFAFDGKPPALKFKEKERRELYKQKAEKSLKKAKTKEEKLKFAKRTSRLTPDIVKDSKELLKALGQPIIQCASEADAQISFMAEKKDVDYAASSDHDCLLYGCPKLLTNLTLSQRRRLPSGTYVKTFPEVIYLKDVLKQFKINQDQLIVVAIMTGTDYNPKGIKGIGPKTALKLVKQYKNFDKLFNEVAPDFNWKQIYAIFKSMPIMKNYQLKWKEIDSEKVKKILIDRHDFAENRVDSMIQRVTGRDKKQTGLSKWVK